MTELPGIYTCAACGAHRTVTDGKAACCGKRMTFTTPLPGEETNCCEVR